MPTVTSKDGTTIAFDKVGSGPAVILVNGALAYRAVSMTAASPYTPTTRSTSRGFRPRGSATKLSHTF